MMAKIPNASTVCGGLTIFTSSPYALCHQLSNGAEASIEKQPQMHAQAPSGARNPQSLTVVATSRSFGRNVHLIATNPEQSPARSPPDWISKCAGVQNESRPIDMCQE